jgi:hypothetical protein
MQKLPPHTLGESVKNGVHGVEHGNHFHRCYAATNLRECYDIRKENRNAVEHLGRSEENFKIEAPKAVVNQLDYLAGVDGIFAAT